MDMAGLMCLLFCLLINFARGKDSYRAAVVEFAPFYEDGKTPQEVMRVNALKYDEYAAQAAKEGADLIAFPEYGLASLESYGIDDPTRNDILPELTDVPDPSVITWNPCLNPDVYNDRAPADLRNATYDGTKYTDQRTLQNIHSQVMHILSCSARKHSIVILANLLSREVCDNKTDPNCPSDGRYQHNTNIVFDRNGTLISRYHKRHLYHESPLLDAAVQPEYAIFEVDSIKFATFICFDMIYKDPAVQLVTDKGIKNIVFSTAWINEMPHLLAPQLYSRWAQGLGVNVIATNYYNPSITRLGTGIYSSQIGAVNQTFDISRKGRLIVADLPANPEPVPTDPRSQCIDINSEQSSPGSNQKDTYNKFVLTNEPSSQPVKPIHKIYYQDLANFSITYLDDLKEEVNLCDGTTCCQLTYKLNQYEDAASYALLAYDGIQPFSNYQLGMQTCAVMRCEKKGDIQSCGRVREDTNNVAEFEKLVLTGQFSTNVILPSVVQTDLQLKPGREWNYSKSTCSNGTIQATITFLDTEKQEPVSIVSMYARLFERDETLTPSYD